MTEIDVSGCEYAEKSIPVDCSIANCFCYENKNCYYKQLKRLELENKKLKDTFKEIKTICKEYSENCKIDGNCIDDRLCPTCFFGGAIELIDELNEVLKDE